MFRIHELNLLRVLRIFSNACRLDGRVVIQEMTNLFKCKAFGFRKEEINRDTLDDENDDVHEIKLPGDSFKADRVDILVQNLENVSARNRLPRPQ